MPRDRLVGVRLFFSFVRTIELPTTSLPILHSAYLCRLFNETNKKNAGMEANIPHHPTPAVARHSVDEHHGGVDRDEGGDAAPLLVDFGPAVVSLEG